MSMTINEQRIAIAEWYFGKWKEIQQGEQEWYIRLECQWDKVPNYPLDLNAMHEAEKKLRENQFHYVDYPIMLFYLESGLKWNGENIGYFMFNFIHATSQQRSEAICRTLWPERWE